MCFRRVRVVYAFSGVMCEPEVTASLPANKEFLSPRLFMNKGPTAATVTCNGSGVYVETDYRAVGALVMP